MGSATIDRANEIIRICEVMKALPKDGAFTTYRQKLLGVLQRLSLSLGLDDCREDGMKEAFADALKGKWVTTEDGHRLHIGENGEPDKGNPYVIEAIAGELDKANTKAESRKKYPRKRGMVCEGKVDFENPRSVTKDSLNRNVTHFNHTEDVMDVVKPVYISKKGADYKICKGNIEHLTVFAPNETGRVLDVADKLSEQCGGSPESWKHCKGIGIVEDGNGNRVKADLHWFESPEVGQVVWRLKQFLDDMDENERYWVEGRKNG